MAKRATKSSSKAEAVVKPAPANEVVAVRVARGRKGGLEVQASSTGYEVASGDRHFQNRGIQFDGADRPLDLSTRRKLVSTARALDRNSLLSAMLDRWVDGAVGSSINFRPATGDEGWNKAAKELAEGYMARCDHRGFFDMPTMIRTLLRALGTDGEQLWAMTDEGRIQAIETHQLATPRDRISRPGKRDRIHDGIELDAAGRPVRYWVAEEAYGGYVDKASQAQQINAADCHFAAFRKRASQTHGVPVVTAAMKLYDRVDGYIDNEALAAEIDACLTFFIKRTKANDSNVFPQPGRRQETQSDGTAQTLRKVEPGMIARIAPDEEIDQFGAKRPGNQFTPFVEMGLTLVGATVGVPLPLALLDFKRLNYSNARTMLLQMWQTWQIWHRSHVVPALDWAYRRWIVREVASSRTLRARDDAFAVRWLPRRWPWVDPQKEVQALHDEIALGIATLTDELELRGYTVDEYLSERAAELAKFKAAGVPTSSTSTSATGTSSQAPPPALSGTGDSADDGEGPADPERDQAEEGQDQEVSQ